MLARAAASLGKGETKAAAGGAEPEGHVCQLPALQDLAARLRGWLRRAGVDREQLHKGTSVNKQLRWHDLRSTGATYLAVEGRSPIEIRDILGHTQTSMSDRYMRAAAVLRGGRFGEPFPPLPAAICRVRVSDSQRSEPSKCASNVVTLPIAKVASFPANHAAARHVSAQEQRVFNSRPSHCFDRLLIAY